MPTMQYAVSYERKAAKELADIPNPARKRIEEAVEALAGNPRPNGSKKLVGQDGYRIRIGQYRVVYSIDDTQVTVVVVRVATRGNVYR